MKHRSIWLSFVFGLFALCVNTGTLAQDACSFKAGGHKTTGLTFAVGTAVPGLDARNVIAQMKDIAAADKFEVDQDSFQGSRGR